MQTVIWVFFGGHGSVTGASLQVKRYIKEFSCEMFSFWRALHLGYDMPWKWKILQIVRFHLLSNDKHMAMQQKLDANFSCERKSIKYQIQIFLGGSSKCHWSVIAGEKI